MKILALDSSTDWASAAVVEGGKALAEAALETKNRGSEKLIPEVEAMLERLSLRPAGLDLLAVGLGPGSFSGLRGGLAFIKGLALATGLPVAGVSSLEALAMNAGNFIGAVVPLLDAHRGEVFTAIFRASGDEFLARETEDSAVAPGAVPLPLSGPLLVLGSGLGRYRDELRRVLPPEAIWAPEEDWRPQALTVARLAAKKFAHRGPDDLDLLAPAYVRRSDAELRLGPRTLSAPLDQA